MQLNAPIRPAKGSGTFGRRTQSGPSGRMRLISWTLRSQLYGLTQEEIDIVEN